MRIPSSQFRDWKAAEAELADIERAFKALAADLAPTDRERVTQQLAALKAARLRVLLLFEAVKKERELNAQPTSEVDEPKAQPQPQPAGRDPHLPGAEDWLS